MKELVLKNTECNLLFDRNGYPECLVIHFRPEIADALKTMYAKRGIDTVIIRQAEEPTAMPAESLCAFAAQGLCVSGYKCDRALGACSAYQPRVAPTHREPCGKVVKDELCEKCPTLKRYSCGVPEVHRNYGPSCANCEMPYCQYHRNDNVLCGWWYSTAPKHPGCDVCSRKLGCDSVFRADNCPDWRPAHE